MRDFFYEDFSKCFGSNIDYNYVHPFDNDVAASDDVVFNDVVFDDVVNVLKKVGSRMNNVRNTHRKTDTRAKISRFTRALLSRQNFPMPNNKSHPGYFERGFDFFLRYVYGDLFAKGSHWYENPDAFEFFRWLINLTSSGHAKLTLCQFDRLFFKKGSNKSCRWDVNDDVVRELGLTVDMIVQRILLTK